MIKLPKYVSTRARKDGSFRFYFQVPEHMRPKSWPKEPIRLNDDVGEMFRQAGVLYQKMKGEAAGLTMHVKGSLPWVIEKYHQSPAYKNTARSTKDLWEYSAKEVLDWSKDSGNPHVRHLTRPAIFLFLEQFDDKPAKKKNVHIFLRRLLAYACDIGEIEINPALRMKIKTPEAYVHIWTDAELNAIVAKADELGFQNVGNAVLIGYSIGQRQGDILSFQAGRDYIDGRFLFRQSKTGQIVSIKAVDALRSRLDGIKTGLLVRDRDGGPYVRRDFLRDFRAVVDAAALPHCIFAKLRHTAIVRLARAGCTHSEIAAITGHSEASVAGILKKYLPRDSGVADNAISKVEKMG